MIADPTFGTTVVKAVRPESELIEITTFGSLPFYIERWRGWIVEDWSDWEWIEA